MEQPGFGNLHACRGLWAASIQLGQVLFEICNETSGVTAIVGQRKVQPELEQDCFCHVELDSCRLLTVTH